MNVNQLLFFIIQIHFIIQHLLLPLLFCSNWNGKKVKFYNCVWLYPNTILFFPFESKSLFLFQLINMASFSKIFNLNFQNLYKWKFIYLLDQSLFYSLLFPLPIHHLPTLFLLLHPPFCRSICMEYFLCETKEEEFIIKLISTTTLIIIKICQFFI